jgi:hypothetical protein
MDMSSPIAIWPKSGHGTQCNIVSRIDFQETNHADQEEGAMTGTRGNGLSASLSDKISGAFGSLWAEYADQRPSEIRTEIRGNVVTCKLIDAVGKFGEPTPAGYKRDAVAAVVRLTRQRVASFVSSHDRDTDVATEVFTLEPSLQNGRRKGPN